MQAVSQGSGSRQDRRVTPPATPTNRPSPALPIPDHTALKRQVSISIASAYPTFFCFDPCTDHQRRTVRLKPMMGGNLLDELIAQPFQTALEEELSIL
ncbi:hypothetical protein Zmor_024169 [Zophobas morio]|uniref:Uncharacterized protein n=1 Tax=Zophobas morio TaxID=2755281 RepID=A0AA38I2H5_9CUCU|nr:hypothetical protein Zmor_024169 [Zophobas morio]